MLRINSLQIINKKLNEKKVQTKSPKMRSRDNSTSRLSSKKRKELNIDLVPVNNQNYLTNNNAYKKYSNAILKETPNKSDDYNISITQQSDYRQDSIFEDKISPIKQ